MQRTIEWLKRANHNRIIAVLFGITIIFVEVVAAFDVYESSLWTVERQLLAITKTVGLACLFVITLVAQTARPRGKARVMTLVAAALLFLFIGLANTLINYEHNQIPESVYLFFANVDAEHINRAWSIAEAGMRQVVTAICWLVFGLLWSGEAFGEIRQLTATDVAAAWERSTVQPVRVVSTDNGRWPPMPEGITKSSCVRQLLTENPNLLEQMPKEFAEHYGQDYYHTFARLKGKMT